MSKNKNKLEFFSIKVDIPTDDPETTKRIVIFFQPSSRACTLEEVHDMYDERGLKPALKSVLETMVLMEMLFVKDSVMTFVFDDEKSRCIKIQGTSVIERVCEKTFASGAWFIGVPKPEAEDDFFDTIFMATQEN